MTIYRGAEYLLDTPPRTNVFIISPNNSGSTFLRNALATSKHFWSLEKEGQHTYGFSGPSTQSLGASLIWSTREEWLNVLSDKNTYDWPTIQRAWYFQAKAKRPSASIFITSTPPFLTYVKALQQNFSNAKFIYLVRNPYAVVESIYRVRHHLGLSADESMTLGAKHIMYCLNRQKENISEFTNDSVFFSYEYMCDKPEKAINKIQNLLPVVDDLTFDQNIPVKGNYNEPIRNMNDQQIARLTSKHYSLINKIFEQHEGLLDHFGYELLSGRSD